MIDPSSVSTTCEMLEEMVDDARIKPSGAAFLAQLEEVVACSERHLQEVREAGDHKAEASILINLGRDYAQLGRREQALSVLEAAIQLGEAIQDIRVQREAKAVLAKLRSNPPLPPVSGG